MYELYFIIITALGVVTIINFQKVLEHRKLYSANWRLAVAVVGALRPRRVLAVLLWLS